MDTTKSIELLFPDQLIKRSFSVKTILPRIKFAVSYGGIVNPLNKNAEVLLL